MNPRYLIKLTLFCFILFLFLLPFQIWNETVFPSQTGKILFAGWAAIILSAFITFYFFLSKSNSYKITIVDFVFGLYVLYYYIHVLFIKPQSLHPFSAIEIFVLVLVYFFVRLQSSEHTFWILSALIVPAFIQSFNGILQYFSILPSQHNTFKVTGTFFNPAPFGGYLAASFPVILGVSFYLFKLKQKKHLYILSPVILTVIGALFLSKSRAAWLAASVASVYLFGLFARVENLSGSLNKSPIFNRFQNLKYRKLIFSLIAAFLMVAAIWTLYSVRPESANGRILVWKGTAQMIADYPVTGVGPGRFASNYMHYQAEYLKSTNNVNEILLADNTIYAFNEFIRLTAEQGIPVLFLVLFLFLIIFKPVPNNDFNFIVAKSGILSILVFGLFSYPGSVLPIKVLFVIFFAIVSSQLKQYSIKLTLNTKVGKIVKPTFATVLAVSSFLYFLNLNSTTFACHEWKSATDDLKSNKLEPGIEHCKIAYPFLKSDGFFMILYGNLLKKADNYDDAETILEEATHLLPLSEVYLSLGDCYLEQQKFGMAENAYKYALQMVPSRIKPIYSLAKLYMLTGKEHEALCIIENYLESEPKKRTIASYEIELSMIELKKDIETFFK